MSRRRLRLSLLLISMLGGFAEAATVQHSEPLRAYRVGARDETPPAATAVSFNAFSRDFVLELEPNGRMGAHARPLGTTAAAYRGKIAGVSRSWVRVVLTPEGPSGLVFDGETLYGIETGDDATAASGSPVMFRLADVYLAPGELGCETGSAAIDAEQAVAAMAREVTTVAAAAATRNLDLGAVADFEFSQAFGANAEAALLTRLNNVDGIFSEQLGIQITVAAVDIFTSSDDPFTTSASGELLEQLASYRGATPSQDALGLTHLLTGRDLDGGTTGIAYLGAVCSSRPRFDTRSFGAGLSESRRGAVLDSLVIAHEIGHNFGAPHDGDANGACASTPTTFLMAPSVSGSNRFSACSVEQMQAEIAAAACLTPLGPADLAVSMLRPPQALAGLSFTHTATVRNRGADEASGVILTASAEPALAIAAAEADGASCTVSQDSAACPLGAVGGGAARVVTLTMRADEPGTFALTASAAANSDADASDNSETEIVTVVPGVDLVWSAAAASVQLDAQTTVEATLENAADFAATGVAVTATLSTGLRGDRAVLGGAACTISGPSLSCPTQSLAARGTVALVLEVTGTAAGNQLVTLDAVSSEPDRAPGDNQRAAAVTVGARQESGGGGAVSWWAAALLLLLYGWSRGCSSRGVLGRRRLVRADAVARS